MPLVNVTNFVTAVAELRRYAAGEFNRAKTRVDAGIASPPSGTAPDQAREFAKQQAADVAKAQGAMAAAFAQLADLEAQEQKAIGYAHVVRLMGTTADHAKNVYDKIVSAMALTASSALPQSEIDGKINALTNVITALGALSPAQMWHESPPPAAAT